MQKSKSKSKGKNSRPINNDQLAPQLDQADQSVQQLTDMPLNKIDVDTLVQEQSRLRMLIEQVKGKDVLDGDGSSKLENLSTVLLQALHTKDEQLINYALEKDDDTLIENTVKNLLTSKVPGLLQSLAQAIVKKTHNAHVYLKWLKSLLKYHMTVLLTPAQQPAINQIKSVLANRSRHLVELTKLKGKMSAVLSKPQRQMREEKQAKINYIETQDNRIIEEQN